MTRQLPPWSIWRCLLYIHLLVKIIKTEGTIKFKGYEACLALTSTFCAFFCAHPSPWTHNLASSRFPATKLMVWFSAPTISEKQFSFLYLFFTLLFLKVSVSWPVRISWMSVTGTIRLVKIKPITIYKVPNLGYFISLPPINIF